jgi:hypothetical protein
LRPLADAGGEGRADDSCISPRYPVVWCEQPGHTYAGSLVLGPASLTLDGVDGGSRSVVELSYGDLKRVRMARAGKERMRGRPTLVVDVTTGRSIRIAAVAGTGVMGEVADALTRAITVA